MTSPELDRYADPGSPSKLSHELLAAHADTLSAPRRSYGLPARALFWTLDAVYSKRRTLSKFKVLELVARVPYQSWEQAAHIAITHMHQRTGMARGGVVCLGRSFQLTPAAGQMV